MPSTHRWKCASVLALPLFIAAACSDAPTSSLVPASQQVEVSLPSLTVGGRTMTLVGSELLLANGARIPMDSVAAKSFRAIAIAAPKIEALERQMKPVWSGMGLPDPSSPLASVALAAYRARSASGVSVDAIGLTNGPLTPATAVTAGGIQNKPTLIAECDPAYQFCGFDTGDPEQGTGGGGGSGGGGSGGGPSPYCVTLATQLYAATISWKLWLNLLVADTLTWAQCARDNPSSVVTSCSAQNEITNMEMLQVAGATAVLQGLAQLMRVNKCV
ncbi:MAG: hypothetical protein ABI664_02125 [bacterium]